MRIQKEFAEFAWGQVVALGIASFLLTVIILIGSPASPAQHATSTAPTAQKPALIAS
jgi:hypothetical protein